MTVKLIAHTLIQRDRRYLLNKRTAIKRGKLNVYPHFWDIPGGSVDLGGRRINGERREAVEEIGLEISLEKIIHEDGEYDAAKATVFTRLVYAAVPNQ